MIDPILEARILRVVEVIPPGFTFAIGRLQNTGEEAFVLGMPMCETEWALLECTFDEAIEESKRILEAYQWN